MKKYLYRNKKGMEILRDYKPGFVEVLKIRLKGYKLIASCDYTVTEKEKKAK